jgi:hypothetical protein
VAAARQRESVTLETIVPQVGERIWLVTTASIPRTFV